MTNDRPVGEGAAVFIADAPPVPPTIRRTVLERITSLFARTVPLNRDRVQQPGAFPWNAVCLLNFFRNNRPEGHGTGFFIDNDVVVTAAHSLFRANPDAVGIYPAYDAQLNPTIGISAKSWAWHGSRDVGVLISKAPGAARLGVGSAPPAIVSLAGYAFPYPNGAAQMTVGAGQWSRNGTELQYRIGVDEGDSGSPVFVPDQGNAIAMAVHFERRLTPASGVIGVGEFADDNLREVLLALEQRARNA